MSPPHIETTDLHVFAAAVRLGSFAAAAADLRLSTPSVSARLAALERRLGVVLFERGARGSTPTPAGERLADYARRCLDLLDEAVADLGTERAQRLILAAPATLGSSVFPPALAALEGKPVAVHCRIAHSDEVIRMLRDGTAHAGFILAGPTTAPVRSVRVTRSAIIAVCHPGHPLADRKRLNFADLNDTAMGVYRWGPESESLAAVFEHPQRPGHRPVHTIGLPLTAIQLATDAGYVAVVPRFAASRAIDQGRLCPLPLPLTRWKLEIRFIYLPGALQRPGVTALLDNLASVRDALGER